MNKRPILFSTPMVQALLDGRKTQTRRIATHPLIFGNPRVEQIVLDGGDWWTGIDGGGGFSIKCPYGKVGDLLYVRERFCWKWIEAKSSFEGFYYYADGQEVFHVDGFDKSPWKPSIHMPRAASRLTLEITDIRVERLQDISDDDAFSEGLEYHKSGDSMEGDLAYYFKDYLCKGIEADDDGEKIIYNNTFSDDPIASYKTLWESINGKDSWAANPWVWVVEFKVHKKNIDNL